MSKLTIPGLQTHKDFLNEGRHDCRRIWGQASACWTWSSCRCMLHVQPAYGVCDRHNA